MPAQARLRPLSPELKRPEVALMLLWVEYRRGVGDAGAPRLKYTSFCVKYRERAARLKRSMRQTHGAVDQLFVDYAGRTLPVVSAATAELQQRSLFLPRAARPPVVACDQGAKLPPQLPFR